MRHHFDTTTTTNDENHKLLQPSAVSPWRSGIRADSGCVLTDKLLRPFSSAVRQQRALTLQPTGIPIPPHHPLLFPSGGGAGFSTRWSTPESNLLRPHLPPHPHPPPHQRYQPKSRSVIVFNVASVFLSSAHGILSWNCNGLKYSSKELANFLSVRQMKVACIQETKLKASSKLPRFPNYAVVRRDCPVCLFVCLLTDDSTFREIHFHGLTQRG